MNQFLTARFQHCSDLCRRTFAFDYRLKVTQQMSPVELMAMIVQMAVGRVAITANDASELFTQQFGYHTTGASALNRKQRAGSTNDRPQSGFQAIFTRCWLVMRFGAV